MRHIAIIGSGPAGYYTAEALQKQLGEGVEIDVIDRLPVPFGLIRFGVAPDHQSIKAVAKRYEKTASLQNVRFVGNVTIGTDVTIGELQGLYDAVVLATGAPDDRLLTIPGADKPGVMGSAAFVGWYNGHPSFAGLRPPLDSDTAVIVGNGNVALDVARILAKTQNELASSDIVAHARLALETCGIKRIVILGRRGPHQIAMTPKELGELGHLERASPHVEPADLPPLESDDALEPGQRKSVGHLRQFAALPDAERASKSIAVVFDFFASPVEVLGDDHVTSLRVERTALDANNRATGTGETYDIPCGLVVSCIGYQTPAIADVPYDPNAARFANEDGLITPDLYCVGWARRGPSGTIGTNKTDGYAIAQRIIAEVEQGSAKPGRAGLDALIAERGLDTVTFRDWQRIDAAEIARARNGAPREKFVDIAEMIAARHG